MSPYSSLLCVSSPLHYGYTREERFMTILAGYGKCESRGHVGREKENQNEVGTTGTFPIFYLLAQSIRVAAQHSFRNIGKVQPKPRNMFLAFNMCNRHLLLTLTFPRHGPCSQGYGLNLHNEVTAMGKSKEMKRTSTCKLSPAHCSLSLFILFRGNFVWMNPKCIPLALALS